MTIEALLPDPRRAGTVRVVADGRPAWTVPISTVEELGLRVGGALGGLQVARLDEAAEEEGALRAGLRALERRAHGTAELRRKLRRHGHADRALDRALPRLATLGLLDDAAFAREYVSLRSARGHAPLRLRRDLGRLGIDARAIEEALRPLRESEDEPLRRPRELVERRARQLDGLPREARRRRLMAYLGRRGYRGTEARAVVEEALRVR